MVVQTVLGGKRMKKLLKAGILLLLLLSFVLTGCQFGIKKTTDEMDAPPVNYVEEGDSLQLDEGAVEASDETGTLDMVERELYLIDANGYVVPQTVSLPKKEGVLRQLLEYLVIDGPVSEVLPNGFQAVIPAGTEVDVKLTEEGVAIVDFSNEFKEYHAEDELKILQSITWTLTQFDTVDKVQFRINGYDIKEMPINGTPIGDGYSRADGINLESDQVIDIVASEEVTLYFLSNNGENNYYVPVTRRVEKSEDKVTTIVQQLLNGPSAYSPLLTDFRNGIKLLDEPILTDGIVTLNFNEAILTELEQTAISNEALNMFVLSLTEQKGIEQVALQVNGDSEVLRVTGEQLSEPVIRPQKINGVKL